MDRSNILSLPEAASKTIKNMGSIFSLLLVRQPLTRSWAWRNVVSFILLSLVVIKYSGAELDLKFAYKCTQMWLAHCRLYANQAALGSRLRKSPQENGIRYQSLRSFESSREYAFIQMHIYPFLAYVTLSHSWKYKSAFLLVSFVQARCKFTLRNDRLTWLMFPKQMQFGWQIYAQKRVGWIIYREQTGSSRRKTCLHLSRKSSINFFVLFAFVNPCGINQQTNEQARALRL